MTPKFSILDYFVAADERDHRASQSHTGRARGVGAKLKDPEQLAGGAVAGVSYLRNGWAADGAAFPRPDHRQKAEASAA